MHSRRTTAATSELERQTTPGGQVGCCAMVRRRRCAAVDVDRMCVLILKGADKKNGTRTIWLAHEAEGLSPLEAAAQRQVSPTHNSIQVPPPFRSSGLRSAVR